MTAVAKTNSAIPKTAAHLIQQGAKTPATGPKAVGTESQLMTIGNKGRPASEKQDASSSGAKLPVLDPSNDVSCSLTPSFGRKGSSQGDSSTSGSADETKTSATTKRYTPLDLLPFVVGGTTNQCKDPLLSAAQGSNENGLTALISTMHAVALFGSKTEKLKALGEQLETDPQSGNQAVRDDALSTMKELSVMLGELKKNPAALAFLMKQNSKGLGDAASAPEPSAPPAPPAIDDPVSFNVADVLIWAERYELKFNLTTMNIEGEIGIAGAENAKNEMMKSAVLQFVCAAVVFAGSIAGAAATIYGARLTDSEFKAGMSHPEQLKTTDSKLTQMDENIDAITNMDDLPETAGDAPDAPDMGETLEERQKNWKARIRESVTGEDGYRQTPESALDDNDPENKQYRERTLNKELQTLGTHDGLRGKTKFQEGINELRESAHNENVLRIQNGTEITEYQNSLSQHSNIAMQRYQAMSQLLNGAGQFMGEGFKMESTKIAAQSKMDDVMSQQWLTQMNNTQQNLTQVLGKLASTYQGFLQALQSCMKGV